MDPKLEDYTSRKFLLALLSMAQVSVAFFMGKIPFEYWLGFLVLLVFGYGALNLFSAFVPSAQVPKPPEAKP